MSKTKAESTIRKLYHTLIRLGVTNTPDYSNRQNIYIDDSGFVMMIMPDGVVDILGPLSFSGEFICKMD